MGAGKKSDKFVKTQKKLPDLKMGQIENMTGKNMTFSSDSEEPNGVRFDKEFIFKVVAYD